MAIYEVSRTDTVEPGEFVSAVVVAAGVDQARRAVAHFPGVKVTGKGRNVQAQHLNTTGQHGARIITTYTDEREPAADDQLTLDDISAASYLS